MQRQFAIKINRHVNFIGTLGMLCCLLLAGAFTQSLAQGQNSNISSGNLRAALNQWANPTSISAGAKTMVGNTPALVQADGANLWVANARSNTVSRVRASDGKLLETWTGAATPTGILVARGLIYVTGNTNPTGSLYSIDPRQPVGNVSVVASNLGAGTSMLTTDGTYIWSANSGPGGINGSVSRINPDTGAVMTFSAGFGSPAGILFDGSRVWVTDAGDNSLKRINANGVVDFKQFLSGNPQFPVFDGVNIWVPIYSARAVLVFNPEKTKPVATLQGNGLVNATTAAFDGQRILVTNNDGHSVSLWNAADQKPLGSFSTGAGSKPYGACSDGINFWLTLEGSLFSPGHLARF